jgi:folate-binding protein YgfZ
VLEAAAYEQVTEGVGLLERSDRVKLLLTGTEAAEFLQGQVTNDVEGLETGQGCYALLLTPKGKIRADLRVLRGPDWLRLDAERSAGALLTRTVQMYSIGRDVRSEDQTESRTVLSVLGPGARDALDAAPPNVEHAWVEGRHGIYVTTDLGVDILCPTAEREAVRRELDLPEVSEEVAECLRIEAGRPRHGRELTEEVIPQEAGLNDRAVSFTKGCYVGQETVARLYYKGRPNRRLRGLRLAAPALPGDEVVLDGRRVGAVGSACVSPSRGPIALALVRREAEPGALVTVGDVAGSAEIVDVPFALTPA